jgi:hypothetical protein
MAFIILLAIITAYSILNSHKSKEKKIKEYNLFCNKVFYWAIEIDDSKTRESLLVYHLSSILSNGVEDTVDKWKRIPEFREHIEMKWGHHIPSLKKEIRDKKIKSILND